jgi:hypothetical protein
MALSLFGGGGAAAPPFAAAAAHPAFEIRHYQLDCIRSRPVFVFPPRR